MTAMLIVAAICIAGVVWFKTVGYKRVGIISIEHAWVVRRGRHILAVTSDEREAIAEFAQLAGERSAGNRAAS